MHNILITDQQKESIPNVISFPCNKKNIQGTQPIYGCDIFFSFSSREKLIKSGASANVV